MKKALCLLLCVVTICLSFFGCSAPNADMTEENITETVKAVETALKNFDTENLEKYVSSPTLSVIMTYAKKHQQFADLGKAIFSGLEMQAVNIDLENQSVTVAVKNKDLSQAANDFAQKLKSEYTTFQLLAKLNDDAFLNTNLKELCEKIDGSSLFPDAIEITLDIRQEKKNLVLSFNSDAENAVSGGALTSIKNIYSAG